MNDSLFECTYTDSEELLRESYGKVRYKGNVRSGIYLLFFAVCVFALAIWQKHTCWYIMAAALMYIGINNLLQPAICARRVMKTIKNVNHGNIPSATITLTDRITHRYKLDTSVILYTELRFAYFLKHSIVLLSEEAYVTFDRNGFTKGTPEGLKEFLRENHPHVKIISKN